MTTSPSKPRFVFIAGAEGSGTTILLRLLAAPPSCVSISGNFTKLPPGPEAKAIADEFDLANREMWDRTLPFPENQRARQRLAVAAAKMQSAPGYSKLSHLFFKRSYPFGNQRMRWSPDLLDVVDVLPSTPIIVIYRDPRASSYSALRRKFDTDIRRCAVVCAEQLALLAAQIKAIGLDRVRILSYEKFCLNPLAELEPIIQFCGLPRAQIQAAVQAERIDVSTNLRYRQELPPETVNFLDQFFSPQRQQEWALLKGNP